MAYRVGVIGTGTPPEDGGDRYAMAYRHADAYERVSDCELVACADIVPENAEAFAEAYDLRPYEDYATMLEEVDPDILSVCTPTPTHADIVTDCLGREGLSSVHCEKPMATTWGECQRIAEAAERVDTKLTFNHQMRMNQVYRRAKELLRSGRVGHLRRLEWSADELYDSGTHMFDMSAFYTDQTPVDWVMTGLDYQEPNLKFGVHNENQAVAVWQYETGVYGLAATGRVADLFGAKFRLVGTAGTIEVGVTDGPPLRVRSATGGWETVPVSRDIWGNRVATSRVAAARNALSAAAERLTSALPYLPAWRGDGPPPMEAAIRSVVDAVRTDGVSELTWANALESTELMFGAWESSRRRSRVELPLDITDNPLQAMVEAGDLPVSATLADGSG